ncbi:hypothetical protein [Aureibacillus halotolerans]|uniref:hypothetical protein n=1 Tax=Aureibacillus halotolerans TaxID=1508390 RepID=UPI00105CA411|nr:hypothetical protein [Aureibacillus halotolerans]
MDKANVRANFKDVKLPTDPRLEVTRSDIVKLGEGHFRFDQMYRFEENGVYNSMVLTGNPSFNESDEAIEIDLSNEITGLYEEDGSSASLRWKDPDTGFTYSVAGFKNVDSESSRMTKEEMLSIYDSYEPITDNEKPAS